MTTSGPARGPNARLKATPTSRTVSESATALNSGPRSAAGTSTPLVPDDITNPAHATKTSLSASLAGEAAATSTSGPSTPSVSTPPQAPRRGARSAIQDPLSDKATAFLIRRVLCPQNFSDKAKGRSSSPAPIEALLPPLTSRNDVDLQLYAFIAIIIRDYVQTWYGKITPDESFVAEIVQIVAHCTRALEQRLRKLDLEALLFDELPELLGRHVSARRTALKAADAVASSASVAADPGEIYHALWPLPALSPFPSPIFPSSISEQAENEAAYRQLLVRAALAVLLPTEDLENECLTTLIGQIFSELLIGNLLASTIAQPWFVWEMIIILSRTARRRMSRSQDSKGVPEEGGEGPTQATTRSRFSWQTAFWTVLRWGFSLTALFRFLIVTAFTWKSLPLRSQRGVASKDPLKSRFVAIPVLSFRIWPVLSNLVELDLRMPWFVGTVSMLQWLALTGPCQVAGTDGVLDRVMSQYVQQHLLSSDNLPAILRTLRGTLFPNNLPGKSTLVAPASDAALQALRRRCANAIWATIPLPVGRIYFGRGGGFWSRSWASSARPDSMATSSRSTTRSGPHSEPLPGEPGAGQRRESEKVESAATAAGAGLDGRKGDVSSRADRTTSTADIRRSDSRPTADAAKSRQQAGDDEDNRILDEIDAGLLDVFGDAYCNKHLWYSMLELVLVRLMPELAEHTVTGLWEERLS